MFRIIFFLILSLVFNNSFAEEVKFKNGKALTLDVVGMEADTLKAKAFGVLVKYDISDVSLINGKSPKDYFEEYAKSSYDGVKGFYQQGINSALAGDFLKSQDCFNQGSGYNIYGFDFKSPITVLDDISAKKVTPGCAKLLFKGLNYYLNNQYSEAVKEYQGAAGIDPDYPLTYKFSGFSYYFLKQYNEAIDSLNNFFKLETGDSESAYYLGASYFGAGRNKEAIIWFNKALELNGNYTAAYLGLGDTYLAMEKPQYALPSFKKASYSDRNNIEAYFKMGVVYFILGENEESRVYLRKAKEMYQQIGDVSGLSKTQEYLDKSF